jgi:hypothetical protein
MVDLNSLGLGGEEEEAEENSFRDGGADPPVGETK